ncbi:MAG TPA: DUF4380 domain-containing protein [Propionibacteriaceae bacterium]|nr:DUF4380 domain-containing protein [Propionibacteriaceae bacterium]
MPIDQGVRPIAKRCGSLEVEFLPAVGGRLASLRHAGVDLVLPPGRVPGFYGDTFWPSPQSRFDWPPPPVLDAEPYDVLADTECELTMRSAPDPDFGFQVGKHFTLSEHGLATVFTLTNTWPVEQDVAPWQVTRATREGLLVWAGGEPFTDADRLQKQREDPGCTYLHAATPAPFEGFVASGSHASLHVPSVTRTSKFFSDARGWLAHVHHGTVFLRIFPDLTLDQIAPRQGEVELFFDPVRDYIEIENQGPYETLAPGAALSYAVEWRFGAVDPDIPTDRITPELLRSIHALLAPSAPALAQDTPPDPRDRGAPTP